ncbi:PH domain-containing protein [Candidatus Saccharibacteria bacterium]|nr:PH domain-containing protein [Candidatus Saccharibacteria bacterium]
MSGKDKVSSAPERVREFPGQHTGESVDFVFRQHPLVMRKRLIYGMFALVLAALPWDFPQIYDSPAVTHWVGITSMVIIAAVLFAWFQKWVGWYYSVYIVTDRRVIEIKQRGFFRRSVNEWQLNNISNVNYDIGGFQAVIFGFGDIICKSYLGDFSIKTVHHPADIHQQLLDAVRRGGGGTGVPARSTPASN